MSQVTVELIPEKRDAREDLGGSFAIRHRVPVPQQPDDLQVDETGGSDRQVPPTQPIEQGSPDAFDSFNYSPSLAARKQPSLAPGSAATSKNFGHRSSSMGNSQAQGYMVNDSEVDRAIQQRPMTTLQEQELAQEGE